MNDQLKPEEQKAEFFRLGTKFFAMNSGKNTPNILHNLDKTLTTVGQTGEESSAKLCDSLGRLEKVIKEADETSTRAANALNRITILYVILTAVIAISTTIQVIVALKNN
jgi:hypothetical protein